MPAHSTLPLSMKQECEVVLQSALKDYHDASQFRLEHATFAGDGRLVLTCSGMPLPATDGPDAWIPDPATTVDLVGRTWQHRYARWNRSSGRVEDLGDTAIRALRATWPLHLDCPLECGPGWTDLIGAALELLEEASHLVPVEHIYQKYGGLRILGGANTVVGLEVISVAEHLSEFVCELCGAPGRVGGHQYLISACERHRIGSL